MLMEINKDYKGVVYYPKQYSLLYAFVFMIGTGCLVWVLLMMSSEEIREAAWFLIMGGIGVVGCLFLAIGYARFRIWIREEDLIAIPMFGRKKVIPYKQITGVTYSTSNKLIIMKGRKTLISVGNYAIGYRELCELCRERGKFELR